MTVVEKFLAQQRAWALLAGKEISKDYTADYSDNLFQLNDTTKQDFLCGKGSEFVAARLRAKPKIQALRSSSALACNLFDYWRERDVARAAAACRADAGTCRLEFESTCLTPLGSKPHLDLKL